MISIATATTRPPGLGLPFTHWSLRKLAACLGGHPARTVRTGRERLRQILHERQISFLPLTPAGTGSLMAPDPHRR